MKAPGSGLRRRALYSGSSGQSIVEFALVLPFLMIVVLGVTELGYALIDSHIVTKLAREGSNLISRDTSIQDATTAMRSMMALSAKGYLTKPFSPEVLRAKMEHLLGVAHG